MNYTAKQEQAMVEFQAALDKFVVDFEMFPEEATMFTSDWYLVGSAQDVERDDRTFYFRACTGGRLPPHRIMGLLEYARDKESYTELTCDHDDDDD